MLERKEPNATHALNPSPLAMLLEKPSAGKKAPEEKRRVLKERGPPPRMHHDALY